MSTYSSYSSPSSDDVDIQMQQATEMEEQLHDVTSSSNSDESDNFNPSPPPSPRVAKEIKKRGSTTCAKLEKKKDKTVTFDEYNRGTGVKDWSTFVCLVVRRRIKITYESWKKVPDRRKEKCWQEVKQVSDLKNDDARSCTLKQMN